MNVSYRAPPRETPPGAFCSSGGNFCVLPWKGCGSAVRQPGELVGGLVPTWLQSKRLRYWKAARARSSWPRLKSHGYGDDQHENRDSSGDCLPPHDLTAPPRHCDSKLV